jgi:hypothetical protein
MQNQRKQYTASNSIPVNWAGYAIGGVVVLLAVGIGGMVLTQVFFGTAMAVGFVVLVKSNERLQWLVEHSNIWIDLLIFVGSIYAMGKLGVTISGALVIFGIEYTTMIAPHFRKAKKRRSILNYK